MNELTQKSFGERIRELREARHMTLETVMQDSGVDISTLSRLERGKTDSVNISRLVRLAQTFRVSVNHLVGLEEPMHSSEAAAVAGMVDSLLPRSRALFLEVALLLKKHLEETNG
jgi:transcriptional regulator with XRE-family HTH domain